MTSVWWWGWLTTWGLCMSNSLAHTKNMMPLMQIPSTHTESQYRAGQGLWVFTGQHQLVFFARATEPNLAAHTGLAWQKVVLPSE